MVPTRGFFPLILLFLIASALPTAAWAGPQSCGTPRSDPNTCIPTGTSATPPAPTQSQTLANSPCLAGGHVATPSDIAGGAPAGSYVCGTDTQLISEPGAAKKYLQTRLIGSAAARGPASVDNMVPAFACRLANLMQAADKAAYAIRISSGWRDAAAQNNAVNNSRPGYACTSGESCPHVQGRAADLTFNGSLPQTTAACNQNNACNWMHLNASKFQLVFPLTGNPLEPWHIEPVERASIDKNANCTGGKMPALASVGGNNMGPTYSLGYGNNNPPPAGYNYICGTNPVILTKSQADCTTFLNNATPNKTSGINGGSNGIFGGNSDFSNMMKMMMGMQLGQALGQAFGNMLNSSNNAAPAAQPLPAALPPSSPQPIPPIPVNPSGSSSSAIDQLIAELGNTPSSSANTNTGSTNTPVSVSASTTAVGQLQQPLVISPSSSTSSDTVNGTTTVQPPMLPPTVAPASGAELIFAPIQSVLNSIGRVIVGTGQYLGGFLFYRPPGQ